MIWGNRAACSMVECSKTPFQAIRERIHEGNSKLASFWSKLRNVGQVGIAKGRIELSNMFISPDGGFNLLVFPLNHYSP